MLANSGYQMQLAVCRLEPRPHKHIEDSKEYSYINGLIHHSAFPSVHLV